MSLEPTTTGLPDFEEEEIGPIFEDPILFDDPTTEEVEMGARFESPLSFANLYYNFLRDYEEDEDNDDDDDEDEHDDDDEDDNDDDDNGDEEEVLTTRPSRRGSPSSDDSTDTIMQIPSSDWHFNIPSAERRTLMYRLDSLVSGFIQPHQFWACILVCQIVKLHWLVELATISVDSIEKLSDKFTEFPSHWVRRWNQRTTPTNSPTMSGHLAGRKSARRQTWQRDGGQCIVTGSRRNVKILELCPPDLGEATRFSSEPSIWPFLDFLWLPETIARWRRALFPYYQSTKQVQNSTNMMCLRADIIEMYKRGFVGFFPVWVSSDKTTMELELHWLPEEWESNGPTHRRLSDLPIPTKYLDQSHGFAVTLRDEYDEPYRIKSGHRLFLQTNNPIERPLPDMDLVQLAWYMSLIVGTTGAGQDEELEDEGDSDDGMGGDEEEEDEDGDEE